MTDPRRLRPGDLCRLLNSTPLGEVLRPSQLQAHRNKAGFRIGDAKHVDLVRYVGWLVRQRHAPASSGPNASSKPEPTTGEAAVGAAALGSRKQPGSNLTAKQEALIAALLVEPTYAKAAAQAGVSETTLYRWMREPSFRAACRAARRELVEAAVGRIQSASGEAVDALLAVARTARRDGDRVRAAVAILDHADRGLANADTLHGGPEPVEGTAANTSDVVAILAGRLKQLDRSELPTAEKVRLTASLAEALLRAVGVDILDKRLEALQSVVLGRRDKGIRP